MSVKIELDPFHGHEALDRVHMISVMLEQFLSQHPFVEQHQDVKQAVEDAADRLGSAYQMIGQLTL